MRRPPAGAVVALAMAWAGPGTATTIPGAEPGTLALAGRWIVATRSGPVRAGPLAYDRTDAWRLRVGAPEGPRHLVVVRTSAGRMTPAPVSAASDGTFALVASGIGFAPPVIWCCHRDGMQEVLESDGRPGARRAVAVWVGSGGAVRYVTIGDGPARLVAVSATTGDRVEATIPGPSSPGRAAVAGDRVAWSEALPDDRWTIVRIGTLANGALTLDASLRVPGPVAWLALADGRLALLAGRPGRWRVLAGADGGGPLAEVWHGRRRPLVAIGGGRVAVVDGTRLLVGRRSPLAVAALPPRRPVAIAVSAGRVAWLEPPAAGSPRRTAVVVR